MSSRSMQLTVILGCVEPVAEQGGDIARIAVNGGHGRGRTRYADQPLLQLGLDAVNLGAAKIGGSHPTSSSAAALRA